MTGNHKTVGEDDATIEAARRAYQRGFHLYPSLAPILLADEIENRERYAIAKVLDQLIELGWQRPPRTPREEKS